MLSLTDIRRIIQSGKPIVWTMHDMWPFTGICHYAGDCDKYATQCHNCPQLYKGSRKDIAYRTFQKKKKLFEGAQITFVACSRWLESLAKKSDLIKGQTITNIPNAINTNLFKPRDKKQAREKCHLPQDKKLLLFGSVKITDKRKGIDYLVSACKQIASSYPDFSKELGVVVFWQPSRTIRFPVSFPYLSDELCQQREGTGRYLQRSRLIRHTFFTRQPTQYHRRGNGLWYSVHRVQCRRYSTND